MRFEPLRQPASAVCTLSGGCTRDLRIPYSITNGLSLSGEAAAFSPSSKE
jgi:hypothetical protein